VRDRLHCGSGDAGCGAARGDNGGPRDRIAFRAREPHSRGAMIVVHHLNSWRSQRILWLARRALRLRLKRQW
jgi:hypothetical protein